MAGVASEDLRKKLLAINPFPRLEDVVARCRSEESATNTEMDLASKPVVNVARRADPPSKLKFWCTFSSSQDPASCHEDNLSLLWRTAPSDAKRLSCVWDDVHSMQPAAPLCGGVRVAEQPPTLTILSQPNTADRLVGSTGAWFLAHAHGPKIHRVATHRRL